MVTFENATRNKSMLKVDDGKDTETTSVNVI